MNPALDGRLAARIREIAAFETDSVIAPGHGLAGTEKRRILELAADVFEEYIMQAQDTGCDHGD